jgi:hypothetical protein
MIFSTKFRGSLSGKFLAARVSPRFSLYARRSVMVPAVTGRPLSLLPVVALSMLVGGAFACTPQMGSIVDPTTLGDQPSGGNGAGGPSPGSPGSSSNQRGTGRLSIRLTDSPFSDATAVLVTFSDVRVHRSASETEGEGEWETVPFAGGHTSRTCDLKQLEGPADILGVAQLQAGHYTKIWLTVSGASIHFENAAAAGPCAPSIAPPDPGTVLSIPSGVVKLNREFTLASGGGTSILLDFDGDRSIIQTGPGNGRGNPGNEQGNGQTNRPVNPGRPEGVPPVGGPGNGPGTDDEEEPEEEEEDEEEDEDDDDDEPGTGGPTGYILRPVISVVSVE